ncbi:MAG: iron-sulfur cluster assembly accessory protein [Armatimonadetes bacterium]|nr:iron-sulfur cluster assembly accessory protein [Armatimonadota bacterium]
MSEATVTVPTASGSALVTLTPAAINHVRRMIEKQGNPHLILRMGVLGGGCSGLQYLLRLEEDKEIDPQFDRLFEFDGVRVAVDRKSLVYLAATELDFDPSDLMAGGGFVFRNPNARRTCGCGTSFQT